MHDAIDQAVTAFRAVFFDGVPVMLRQNETSFLSFMCTMAATDALSAYRYDSNNVAERFKEFIVEYFGDIYRPHAENLYNFRCRLLHNFSPAYFTLVHGRRGMHLTPSAIGDYVLEDAALFEDMRTAAEKYFGELAARSELQATMLTRLTDVHKGGAIYFTA